MKKAFITLTLVVAIVLSPMAASASHLSSSERESLIEDFRDNLGLILIAPLDRDTKIFLVRALLENVTQALSNHDEDADRDDDNDDDDDDYRSARNAARDYLEDEEGEEDFEIGDIFRIDDGYLVEVELENGDDVEIELDEDFDVVDYDEADDRDDDNRFLDDNTRVFGDEIEFRVSFDLEADRDDVYVPTDIEDALEFDIEDEDGDVVADQDDLGSSWLAGEIDSSASEDDGFFRIEEDETEEIEFTISFEPDDEDEEYRLVLRELHYNDEDPDDPNESLRFDDDDYATDYYSL